MTPIRLLQETIRILNPNPIPSDEVPVIQNNNDDMYKDSYVASYRNLHLINNVPQAKSDNNYFGIGCCSGVIPRITVRCSG